MATYLSHAIKEIMKKVHTKNESKTRERGPKTKPAGKNG